MREQIVNILKEIKPTKDLSCETAIVEEGFLDSFELMSLIASLQDTFGVEIDVMDIVPENFNSVDAMAQMIAGLKG